MLISAPLEYWKLHCPKLICGRNKSEQGLILGSSGMHSLSKDMKELSGVVVMLSVLIQIEVTWVYARGLPRCHSWQRNHLPVQETEETWVQPLAQEDPLQKDNPLQYFCLENFMDRGAWHTTVHGISKSQTPLSDWACMWADAIVNL